MKYSHHYPAYPKQKVAVEMEHYINIYRRAYNFTRYEYTHVDADNIGSAYKHHDCISSWLQPSWNVQLDGVNNNHIHYPYHGFFPPAGPGSPLIAGAHVFGMESGDSKMSHLRYS
jgi:hypothetical protein